MSQRKRRKFSKGMQSIALGAIVVGSCVFWQLVWMKHVFVQNELHRIDTITNHQSNSALTRNHNDHSSIKILSQEQITSQDEDSPKLAPTMSNEYDDSKPKSFLDLSVIRNSLLREAPWAESHGANHLSYLGAGMLYYSMAYSFRSQTIVVLGSGGGFVPRMLKQAQRDLMASGIRPNRGVYDLYLVDAHLPSAGWGSTFYASNENTTMRTQFSDIRYVFRLTDDAYQDYFLPMWETEGFTIDYLHVDADHGFEQSWRDFDNYSRLLSDRAVVSFHDTCFDNVTRSCHAEGVPETIQKLRMESQTRGLQVMDMHYLYRGIAFAIKESAPALETPSDRRINFCVNNADLTERTSDGFTKNARVGSLGTLGDFMNCTHRYNETELRLANEKLHPDTKSTVSSNIMGIPCPQPGFRRHPVSGRCDKCIPGMTGAECRKFRYKSSSNGPTDTASAGWFHKNVVHIAEGWLQDLMASPLMASRPLFILEVGKNAWTVPNQTETRGDASNLLFGRFLDSSSSFSFNGDVTIVDPIDVITPLWIDPSVSQRYRSLPTTLKAAIDFDDEEKSKPLDKASPLNLEAIDTLVCLACDNLYSLATPSNTMTFLQTTFPHLKRLLLGSDANDSSTIWMQNFTNTELSWKQETSILVSIDEQSSKRLVLFTRFTEPA